MATRKGKRKEDQDLDFDPSYDADEKPAVKKIRKRPKKNDFSFLNEHADKVWMLHNSGSGPTAIAETLTRDHGLNPGAVDAKQVSNWINYRKTSGQGKTRPVSLKNKNLFARRLYVILKLLL
jgi:hypothetical protein